MKPILIFFSALLFYTVAKAQTPDWLWARTGGGAAMCMDNTNDKYGNVIFCGFGYPAPDFGNISLPYYGYFVAKADANGTVLYADGPTVQRAAYLWMSAEAVCTDTFGNIYVTGYFTDTVNIGTDTLTGEIGLGSAFIVKYDTDLDVLWTQKIIGIDAQSSATATSIAVSADGHVYVGGGFDGNITAGPFTLNNTSLGANGYIAMLSAEDGSFIWTKHLSSTVGASTREIAVDGDANVYVNGDFYLDLTLDNILLTNADTNYPSAYVTKLDTNGNLIWCKKVPGAFSIEVNTPGDVFICGKNVTPTLSIDNITLNTSVTQGYTARLNTDGDCQWIQHPGMTGSILPLQITLDALGNIYTSGFCMGLVQLNGDTLNKDYGESKMFVAKYYPDGSIIWAREGGDVASPDGMSLDAAGNIYVSGYYWDTAVFGNHQLVESGQSGYVAKLSSTLSVSELHTESSTRVYPNPASGILNIDIPTAITETKIIDITGKVVLSARSEKRIDLSALSPGIYTLQIITAKGVYREKVTVVK